LPAPYNQDIYSEICEKSRDTLQKRAIILNRSGEKARRISGIELERRDELGTEAPEKVRGVSWKKRRCNQQEVCH
jgi:hypothetical protein